MHSLRGREEGIGAEAVHVGGDEERLEERGHLSEMTSLHELTGQSATRPHKTLTTARVHKTSRAPLTTTLMDSRRRRSSAGPTPRRGNSAGARAPETRSSPHLVQPQHAHSLCHAGRPRQVSRECDDGLPHQADVEAGAEEDGLTLRAGRPADGCDTYDSHIRQVKRLGSSMPMPVSETLVVKQ